SVPWFWLNPLVRISSVFPSGLTAVVTGWSTVNCGRSGSPGFSGWKTDPFAAVGVIIIPVGRTSGCDCEFRCAKTDELVALNSRSPQQKIKSLFEFFINAILGSTVYRQKNAAVKTAALRSKVSS